MEVVSSKLSSGGTTILLSLSSSFLKATHAGFLHTKLIGLKPALIVSVQLGSHISLQKIRRGRVGIVNRLSQVWSNLRLSQLHI